MKQLNPYKIIWVIIKLDGNLSKKDFYELNKKVLISGRANFINFHSANMEIAKQRLDTVVNFLQSKNYNGIVYFITDKQYGLIKNSWNDKIPEIGKPFTKRVILKSDKMTSIVP
jgi:hypothetical protein